MKYNNVNLRVLFLSICLLIGSGCGTGSDPKEMQIWTEIGDQEDEVLVIEYAEEYLFIGTRTGIHRWESFVENSQWVNLGFEINADTSLIGDILYTGEELYVVKRNIIDFNEVPEDYLSLYKSLDLGDEWDAIEIHLEGRERPYVINRIAKANNTLLADWHFIFKSVDQGKTWENLSKNTGVGISEFLYVSKEHPNQIWTGGWNNILYPYLAKSEDNGETWVTLNENVFFNTNANVYAVTVSRKNEKVVLAGFGGGVSAANVIRKSTDGGETWETVLEGYYILDLENSIRNANKVFASGISPTGRLFVAISNNYGDSWEIEEYEESPEGIQTNDMIVVERSGQETLYLATNKGVYSLTFEK